MQTAISVIVGVAIFLLALKILKKVFKAVLFGLVCAGVYWLVTHPEAVSAITALISEKAGGII